MEVVDRWLTRSGPYGRPAKVTCSAKLRCSVMVPTLGHRGGGRAHDPPRNSCSARLEQIVRTNPELVMALIRQLARMAAMAISAAERSR